MNDDDFQTIVSQQDYKKMKQFEQNYIIATKQKKILQSQIKNMQMQFMDLQSAMKIKDQKLEIKNLQIYKNQFQIALLLDLIGRFKSDLNGVSGFKVMQSTVRDSFVILKESVVQSSQNKLPQWVDLKDQQRKIFQKYENQCDQVEQMSKQFSGKTALLQNYQKQLIELKQCNKKDQNLKQIGSDQKLKMDVLLKQNYNLKYKIQQLQKDKNELNKKFDSDSKAYSKKYNDQIQKTHLLTKQLQQLEKLLKQHKKKQAADNLAFGELKKQLDKTVYQLVQMRKKLMQKEKKDKEEKPKHLKSQLNLTIKEKVICLLEEYKIDLDKNINQLQLNQGDSKLMTLAELDQMRKDILKILGSK